MKKVLIYNTRKLIKEMRLTGINIDFWKLDWWLSYNGIDFLFIVLMNSKKIIARTKTFN
jgi:hypothetical protein